MFFRTNTKTTKGENKMTSQTVLQSEIAKSAVILTDYNIGHWFSIVEEDTLNLQAQVTDNYIENNTAIQDHIAISPVTITMRGYIGEVEFKPPVSFTNFLVTGKYDKYEPADKYDTFITEKLSPIVGLLPPVDNITQLAKNAVQNAETSFNRYKRIYNQLKGLAKKSQKQVSETVQEYAARNLKDLWENRKLVEVVTPYGVYNNMAIQSITLSQGNTTTMSELSVTLKQINYATTYTTDPDTERMAYFNALARTQEADHGKSSGITIDKTSALKKITQWRI